MKKREILKGAALFIILLALVAAVYFRIRFDQLNLITGILFLAVTWVLVFVVTEISMGILKRSESSKNNIRLLLVTISILLIGTEIFLRFGLNRYSNYFETNVRGNYESIYQVGSPSWFHVNEANQDVEWVLVKFTHIRKTNSLGLSEEKIALEKAKNEYRIIALGDSYTEGIGTSYDSTWVKIVERNLTVHIVDKKITTINAGISGSDPYFEYILLKEKLLPFNPDLVIIAINVSDIEDVMIRGGTERFQPDGSTIFGRKAPNWEWAYALSYIFRHVIHDVFQYNFLFIRKSEMESEERKAVEKIRLVIGDFRRLSKENGFDLFVVFHPIYWEVLNEEYAFNSDKLISELKNEQSINFLDLLEYYKVNQIMAKENASNFFWSKDGHNNTEGYEIMGNAIADIIVKLKLIKEKS